MLPPAALPPVASLRHVSALPPGAVDAHVHVFEPDRFPFVEGRNYTPGTAALEQLVDLQQGLGVQRAVVVQASVQGTGPQGLLDVLQRVSPP